MKYYWGENFFCIFFYVNPNWEFWTSYLQNTLLFYVVFILKVSAGNEIFRKLQKNPFMLVISSALENTITHATQERVTSAGHADTYVNYCPKCIGLHEPQAWVHSRGLEHILYSSPNAPCSTEQDAKFDKEERTERFVLKEVSTGDKEKRTKTK